MSKKILYIINHMDWFWSHRLPLAQGAQENGFEINVAASSAAKDEKLSAHNFDGYELPPSNILLTIWATHQLLKEIEPDIVHAITLKYAFITGLAVLFHKDVKVVHTLAGLGYLFSGEGLKPKLLRILVGPFLKLALSNAELIFQNPDDQALMIKRGFARAEQCHLIRGSGVDIEQFSYTEEPENNPPIMLMPTRLVHEKGIAIFIEAAKLVQQRSHQAKFQIAGGISSTNPRAITENEMQNMLAGSPVEWLGRVEDMPALLAGCNLIVYPSYYGEGIPKVLLEAASSGRAIITTDHPGCREAVSDNGLLVPVKDVEATADAIEKLLNDPDLRQKMGKKSRAKAEQEFDVKLIVEQTLKLYRHCERPRT